MNSYKVGNKPSYPSAKINPQSRKTGKVGKHYLSHFVDLY